MLHHLQDVFEKSGQFSRVSAGGQGDLNVAIDVLVVRKGSAGLAVLSIATLFIIPTSVTDEYRVTATVTPAGGAPRTYALANTVTTLGGWLMLPVSVVADTTWVTEKTRRNIWNTLILRMQQDGLLASQGSDVAGADYRFRSPVQFTTTVSGLASGPSGVTSRNRCPSFVTT
jgi:hypothetical protein